MSAARKPKLNLTVAETQQERAEKLAADAKRSISNLFEILIDEEWERRHPAARTTDEPSSSKFPRKRVSYSKAKRK